MLITTVTDFLPQRKSSPMSRSAQVFVNAYLLAVMALLPIDWFAPTGLLLREFGSKPVAILLTIGGIYGLLIERRLPALIRSCEHRMLIVIGAFLLLGSAGFFINLVLNWSDWGYYKNPLYQFFFQTLLITAFAISMLGNARLFWRYEIVDRLVSMTPWVAALHLSIFILESLNVIDSDFSGLLLFRNEDGLIDRASGLMSEPSYYGTFAALFGTALIAIRERGIKRLINLTLALALYATAIYVGAKTLLVVVAAQALFLVLRGGVSLHAKVLGLSLLVLTGATTCYFFEKYNVLNVRENMSSAMRFGSTLLALNAASAGFAVTGIGVGQFHFFYRSEFAPEFLLLSSEALDQLEPDAQNRASTFNLYARILLEFGYIGLVVFLLSIKFFMRMKIPKRYEFVKLLFVGSLGFLMTQDTYYYPPLVFSMALILCIRYSQTVGTAPYARYEQKHSIRNSK